MRAKRRCDGRQGVGGRRARLRVGLCLAALLCAAAACAPLIPEVDQQGLEQLSAADPKPLVFDLRTKPVEGQDLSKRIPGAVPLALEEVDGYFSRAPIPLDRPLVFVCDRGNQSQIAGLLAQERGYRQVFNLKGGMAAWRGPIGDRPEPPPPAELRRPRAIPTSLVDQVATVVLGIGVKATYMALSLLVVAILWRSRERGLVLVRQAMIAFFFGEGMCAVNFLFASGTSDPVEVMHGLGMLVFGALLAWGLTRLADDRVLRYEDPAAACAVQRLCGHCWKREAVPCGLHRLFLVVAPACAAISLIPLCAPTVPLAVEAKIFDTVMIDQVSLELQVAEFRLYPLLACALFLVSFALLWGGRRTFAYAQPVFFAGAGFMTFSLMRFFLFRSFRDRILWADGWEEATEFLAIAGVLLFLFFFRRQLDVLRFLWPKPPAGEPAHEAPVRPAA